MVRFGFNAPQSFSFHFLFLNEIRNVFFYAPTNASHVWCVRNQRILITDYYHIWIDSIDIGIDNNI